MTTTYVYLGVVFTETGPVALWTCPLCFGLVGDAPHGDAGRRGHNLWHDPLAGVDDPAACATERGAKGRGVADGQNHPAATIESE